MLTLLFSLFYVTGECTRFLYWGWAKIIPTATQFVHHPALNKTAVSIWTKCNASNDYYASTLSYYSPSSSLIPRVLQIKSSRVSRQECTTSVLVLLQMQFNLQWTKYLSRRKLTLQNRKKKPLLALLKILRLVSAAVDRSRHLYCVLHLNIYKLCRYAFTERTLRFQSCHFW